MNLPVILDIVIGLIFVYLTFSLLASEIQSILTTILQWRAVHLKQSIEELISGQTYIDNDNLESDLHIKKVQQLTNMINSLQIRNIQIEAIIADRLDDFSQEDKEQVKQDAESLYGKIS